MTSTTCPIAVNSAATVCSVRTTPFTCGSHASEMISSRASCLPMVRRATRCPSGSANPASGIVSGGLGNAGAARRHEGQAVQRRPVEQFQLAIMVLNEGGAAFPPIAIVQIQHAVPLPHFGVVDMAAHDAIQPAALCLASQCALEPIHGLHGFLHLAL